MFLCSLLKSAANAVLKLMCAVIAIAHVLSVSMKSLSVSIMLLESSFGKLKYDSTTLHMSGFLGFSLVSASRSPVSLAILNFFIDYFSTTKLSIEVSVDRIPDIKSKLFRSAIPRHAHSSTLVRRIAVARRRLLPRVSTGPRSIPHRGRQLCRCLATRFFFLDTPLLLLSSSDLSCPLRSHLRKDYIFS